jgi:hypothetical protein
LVRAGRSAAAPHASLDPPSFSPVTYSVVDRTRPTMEGFRASLGPM